MAKNNDGPFLQWRQLVDQFFQFNYLVTIEDIGSSDSELRKFWEAGDDPLEFVNWFGQKYDLIRHDHWEKAINP